MSAGTLTFDDLTPDDRGLVPAVVQEVATGAVLMVAWMDRQAYERTLETGLVHFWSRSREALWQKGETSGNVLHLEEILPDCDRDTLLVRAHPAGPTCHTGTRSCFSPNPARLELGWLWRVLEARRGADPETSYTARLLAGGTGAIAKKVGEEAVETVIAALADAADPAAAQTGAGEDGGENDRRGVGEEDSLTWESADLLYHLLVLLAERGLPPEAVAAELTRRHPGRAPGGSAEP